jgi:hypothetical protein
LGRAETSDSVARNLNEPDTAGIDGAAIQQYCALAPEL